MIFKKLSYKARVLICGFIQVLLGIFLTFGLGKSIGFLFCFLILALMCFISAFFGKNPTTRIKKISEKAYKNSQKFSAILGLVFLFLGLGGYDNQSKKRFKFSLFRYWPDFLIATRVKCLEIAILGKYNLDLTE